MKKAAITIGVLALVTLVPGEPADAQSRRFTDIPHLLTGFSAKEACTCAFVIGQTDAYCQAFGAQSGFPALVISIDHAAQKVTTTYADSVATTIRTASAKPGVGCTLDPY